MQPNADLTKARRNAAILVGGESRRMGQPKGELVLAGESLLARAVRVLRPLAARVYLVGQRPDASAAGPIDVPAIPDAPGVRGPLAGVLAALRHEPDLEWIVVGCDMPAFDTEGIAWLLERGRPGFDACLAQLPGRALPEPLLGSYRGSAEAKLRSVAERGTWSMQAAIAALRVQVVKPPSKLVSQWRNVNTPAEWAEFRRARSATPSDH